MRALPTMKSKVDIAIDRIKNFCPPEGYHLADSGGKDSGAILELTKMSGVSFVAHYAFTTVDPPEVIRFIRRYHPDTILHRPKLSMWQLIVKKWLPPTRHRRYCCQYLKEYLGAGEFVMTGIRREESSGRANRKMVYPCFKDSSKIYVNPIIDWSTEDVWEFTKERGLPYCSLYDNGFDRIGCVMCPLASINKRRGDAIRFPKFYNAYLRAFDKMLKRRWANNKPSTTWNCAKDVMDWWLKKPSSKEPEEQLYFTMFS